MRIAAVVAALPAALAAAACSGSSSSGPQATCDQRVDRFAAELATLDGAGIGVPIPADIAPVVSTKGSPVDRHGPTLVIGPGDALAVNGQRITEAELRDRLDAEVHNMRRWNRLGPLYVWADKGTPAAAIERVAKLAPDDLEVRVLLATPEVAPSPYQRELLAKPAIAKLRDEMTTGDPSQRATLIAQRIEKAVGTCAPLIKAFGTVAGVDASDKATFMIDATPKALRACQCKVADLDAIEYALLGVLGAFERRPNWVPVANAATYFGG